MYAFIHILVQTNNKRKRSQVLTDLVGRCTIESIDSGWTSKPPVKKATNSNKISVLNVLGLSMECSKIKI